MSWGSALDGGMYWSSNSRDMASCNLWIRGRVGARSGWRWQNSLILARNRTAVPRSTIPCPGHYITESRTPHCPKVLTVYLPVYKAVWSHLVFPIRYSIIIFTSLTSAKCPILNLIVLVFQQEKHRHSHPRKWHYIKDHYLMGLLGPAWCKLFSVILLHFLLYMFRM